MRGSTRRTRRRWPLAPGRARRPARPGGHLARREWRSVSEQSENAPPRLRPLSGRMPSTAGGTPPYPRPLHPPRHAIALRSASTMIFTSSSNFVCGSQPSFAFALSKLPMSRSTSAGRS